MIKIVYLIFLLLLFNACGGENRETIEVSLEDNSSRVEEVSQDNEKRRLVYIASSDVDYSRLGLKKDRVEAWEDAMRTSGESGSYEWWYSDFIFSDGTTVAVSFYSKLFFDTHGSSFPLVTINIAYPDGRRVDDKDFEFGKKIDASKSIADVHVKSSFLTYENGSYHLHYEKNNITFDAVMVSTLPMWRPKTGHIYFADSEDYFAWLPAQASSTVTATLEDNGLKKELVGIGYHDHNWGNSPLYENINNWYWGRAKVGEYTLIFSDIIAEKKYNYERVPILMIAKNSEILELKGEIEVERKELVKNNQTEKSYANRLRFIQKDSNGKRYTVEVMRKKDILFVDMNRLPFESGNHPTYLRTLSDIRLTIEENGTKVESKGLGVVEQMSFNDDIKNNLKIK